jgi:hypothetical protein
LDLVEKCFELNSGKENLFSNVIRYIQMACMRRDFKMIEKLEDKIKNRKEMKFYLQEIKFMKICALGEKETMKELLKNEIPEVESGFSIVLIQRNLEMIQLLLPYGNSYNKCFDYACEHADLELVKLCNEPSYLHNYDQGLIVSLPKENCDFIEHMVNKCLFSFFKLK